MTIILSLLFWAAGIITSTIIAASYGVAPYTLAVLSWAGLLATCFSRNIVTGVLAGALAGTAIYAWPGATAAEVLDALRTGPAIWLVVGFMVLVAIQNGYERFMSSDFAKNYKPYDDEGDTRWLRVPFDEKDEAKALGARWSGLVKKWYIPAGLPDAPFERWLP